MQTQVERPPEGWRQYAGVFSLVVCPLLLVGYLAARHGLPVAVGVKAIVALYVLNIVPGYLALRFAFRVRTGSAFETMLASLLLGMLITPLVWYAICWLRIGVIFFPAMYSLAAVVPVACGWHRRPIVRLKTLVSAADAPILWVALLLAVLWSCQLGLVHVDGDRVSILPHEDHCLHATLVAELSRGVPMETLPFLAGTRKFAYHFMPDVWAAMMRPATGADPNEGYLYVALPLRYVFLCFGFYLALVRRFGRAGALAGVICVLSLAGFPTQVAAGNPGPKTVVNELLEYLHLNYPMGFGLPAVCLILYCASLIRTQNPRGPLLMASVVSVSLLWYKANLALPVAPAVAILYVVVLVKRRDYRWLGVCAAAQGLLLGIRCFDLYTADLRHTFEFVGANYMYRWWASLHLPASLTGLREVVEGLPFLLQWPIIYALCLTFTFHIGLMMVVYLLIRRRAGGFREERDAGDLLTLLILLCCGIGFVLLPIQNGQDYNISAPIVIMVHALLLALLGPAAWNLVRRAVRLGNVAAVVTVTLALAALVGNTVVLRQAVPALQQSRVVISDSLYEAYRYIKTNTPPRAMILVPRHYLPFTAGVLTQRRVVLERSETWCSLAADTAKIVSDVDAFYKRHDPVTAHQILNRYGVDYVVAHTPGGLLPIDEMRLTEIYRNGNTTVYRVEEDLRLTSLQ